ncbi:MAG: hypothetical protein NVS3B25_09830 [Hymenobacter sp.]
MDQDYIQRLSPADQAWLERFNREFYLAAASCPGNVHTASGLRECWRTVKARQRAECAMALGRSAQGRQSSVESTDGRRLHRDAADFDGPGLRRLERGDRLATEVEDSMARGLDCKHARERATKAREE